MAPQIQTIQKSITPILQKHGVSNAALFGSYARGEQTPESDLDLLVTFSERKSLMDVVGIEQELSDALQVKVDLLTEKAISPYMIDDIKSKAILIYGS